MSANRTLREKMRLRRQAMESTISSDPTPSHSFVEEIGARSKDDVSMLQSPTDDSVGQNGLDESMLQELQTRRLETQRELGDSRLAAFDEGQSSVHSFTEPAIQSTAESHSDTLLRVPSTEGTLNASIKERLRTRMKGLKAQAETQLTGERKFRSLKDRPLPTRFDSTSVDRHQDDELEAVLQASMASAREWKKMKSKQRIEKGMPSEEESYNFFLGIHDDHESDNEDEVSPQSPLRPESDHLAIDMFDNIYLDQWMKPEYIPYTERAAIEDELYAYPGTTPALPQDKVPSGTVPRSLSEEGLYVGSPPPVRLSNLFLMENRILLENKEAYLWFTEEGRLRRLPNPLREQSLKPYNLINDDLDELLQTGWLKADFQPGDPKYINQGKAPETYQLDVDVSSLYFSHHPLFSKEHVLLSRLQQFYNQYITWRRMSGLETIGNKVEALRMSLKEAELKMAELRPSDKLQFEKILLDFNRDIRSLRRQRNIEEYKGRCLLKSTLKTWRHLKMLRTEQGYVNTTSVIKVQKISTDKTTDEAEYQQEITEEFYDMQREFNDSNMAKIAEYNQQMIRYRKYVKRKKAKLAKDDENEEDEEPVVFKPEPPPVFDDNEALRIIEENMRKCKRKPGEPLLIPEMQPAATMTPADQCPRAEQLRRAEMKNCRYFVKVLFNDKEVSRTSSKTIGQDFSLHYGEILNIRILQWPESIKLQIFNASSRTPNILAEVYIPIPGISMVTGTVDLKAVEFSSDHFVNPVHTAVGSGLPVDLNVSDTVNTDPPVTLLTSGFLYSSAAWGVASNGQPMAPPASSVDNTEDARHRDALTALGAAGMIDVERLVSWMREENLDPNDPTNAEILALIKVAEAADREGSGGGGYFRLQQLETEMHFVSDEEFERSKRFRVLQLRDEGVPEFKHLKMVPSSDKHIPQHLFDAYEARQRGIDADELHELPRRTQVSRFIAKVREQILARSLMAKKQLDLQDVVVEDEVPDLGTLGLRIVGLFAPRRPLRPVRKERKRLGAQSVVAFKEVSVLINIVRAFNVPVRMEPLQSRLPQSTLHQPARGVLPPGQNIFSAGVSSPQHRMSIDQDQNAGRGLLDSLVRPFVEILFQGQVVHTSVADGPTPSWNEDLVLSFRAPNDDYSSENLQSVADKLYINLFDEITVDLLVDDRERGTRVHQRLEKHWLGSIELPFSTVYFNSKVEGAMRVNSPPVLLGYQSSRSAGYTGLGLGPRGLSTIKDETYLQLFVTIEPQLPQAQPIAEVFDTAEDPRLLHNAQVWLHALRAKFPKREFKTMVSNISGKKVFLTRFIRAQNPPSDLLADPGTPVKHVMNSLARFVSRIPYVSDSVQFPDLCDIWSYSEQFLNMLSGDEEEHAVLLCNYFLSIGKRAWLLLGDGIPEGSTAYVLSQDDNAHFRLWNASSGESYDSQDPRCPLQIVACIIDETNIWANVQPDAHPSKLDFDVSKTSLWQPFFSRGFPNPGLESVQAETLVYLQPNQQSAVDLQDRIERVLRDKFMEWRPRFVTRWNRYCTQVFRDLLLNIEAKTTLEQTSSDEHKFQLEQISSTHKLTGFPLDVPFTDIDDVTKVVFGTGVHNCEDPHAEFALAVHVHPYPHAVFAVWIYVGRLTNRNIQ